MFVRRVVVATLPGYTNNCLLTRFLFKGPGFSLLYLHQFIPKENLNALFIPAALKLNFGEVDKHVYMNYIL